MDRQLLARMDQFDALKFESIKLEDSFFLLFLNLSKWVNSKIDWTDLGMEFANRVLDDLHDYLHSHSISAANFAGDYSDQVYAVFGQYDNDYERLNPKENAVLVWGSVFEICRNLAALRECNRDPKNRVYVDGEFQLDWMLPLFDAAERTELVSFGAVQKYFEKLALNDYLSPFQTSEFTDVLERDGNRKSGEPQASH